MTDRPEPDEAFEELVGPHRAALLAHCYRMLGSLQDAEDAVQETLLRAWRALPRLEGHEHVRAWLYRIATNRCLTAATRRRDLPVDLTPGTPLGEIAWLEPFPSAELAAEEREGVELAYVAALQHLPPAQRAVLLLRDVLGFSAAEVARQLDSTPAAVHSALARARRALADAAPARDAVRRDPPGTAAADLVAAWARAWEDGDADAVVALLTEDARYSMPPLPAWYAGPAAIGAWLRTGPIRQSWRFLPTAANGRPAFATYLREGPAFRPCGLDVLVTRDGRVTEVVSFLDADPTWFGLPASLDA
ncbi:RNA polymerase subunit sigma-70 [Pseudonocardia sp.]|uniref:RNA polymerase subunit sigma-70 n=1 Tax=Pseudonocardia sp. TaxID=60912 RepID=UPI003D12527A